MAHTHISVPSGTQINRTCADCGASVPRGARYHRKRCRPCYDRHLKGLKRSGTYESRSGRSPALDRLLAKTTPGFGGCVIYTGHIMKRTGYGSFTMGTDNRTTAHRAAYELLVGPIPNGAHVDHACHNRDTTCPGGTACLHRRCMNPSHLEAVTPQENVLRSTHTMAGINARKTHCPRGHEYTPENTGTNSKGRYCLSCDRSRSHRALGAGPLTEDEAVRRSVDAQFPSVAAFLANERGEGQ